MWVHFTVEVGENMEPKDGGVSVSWIHFAANWALPILPRFVLNVYFTIGDSLLFNYASFHNFPLYLMAEGVIPLPFQRHEDRITTITWIKHVVLAESHLAVVLIIVRTSFTFLRGKVDLVPRGLHDKVLLWMLALNVLHYLYL